MAAEKEPAALIYDAVRADVLYTQGYSLLGR